MKDLKEPLLNEGSKSSSTLMNRQWILKSRPQGMVEPTDFEQRTVPIPKETMQKGQVLAQTLYLSFDPAQRGWVGLDTYVPAVSLGQPMRAFGLGQVLESKNDKFKRGDLVFGLSGWQDYFIFDPDSKDNLIQYSKIPGHFDVEQFLTFALTGSTAYAGLKYVGELKAGETVLVSGAAGSTGSFAGQIAKLIGCKVIGIAGGPKKCAFLTEQLHFDAAIDYKNENVGQRLADLCPNGVDVFFDNVGGDILDTALLHLAMRARVVICGAISQYNHADDEALAKTYGLKNTFHLIVKRSRMEGFIVADYSNRMLEIMVRLQHWIEQGKIVAVMDKQEGFDKIPETLRRLFTGENHGKQLLKLADPPLPVNQSIVVRLVLKLVRMYYSLRGW